MIIGCKSIAIVGEILCVFKLECFVWKLFANLISKDKTVRKRRKRYAMMTVPNFV
jgi:hypothetical protein